MEENWWLAPISMLKILILSAGSLVGQNILDALEGRREWVSVIGADAGTTSPRLFRCDVVYRTPSTDEADAFRVRLLEIIDRERPDLVLAGRDHDVNFMSELRDRAPALSRMLPCGPATLARMIQDKWQSFLFCRRNGLPMADTIVTGQEAGASGIDDFVSRHGLPLIAKPRYGAASIGVRVLLEESQLRRIAERPDLVIQPYLAPPHDLRNRFFDPAEGWPLFHVLTDEGQFAAQATIAPDGGLAGEIFCGINTMVMGRSEYTRPVDDAEMEATMRRFVSAAAREGWRGSLNVQFRRLADGSYCAFEIAGRMTGTTSARRLFGYDEIGLLARAFAGVELPIGKTGVVPMDGSVTKSLADFYTPAEWAAQLARDGWWRGR
jgi:carbamoyl-phosphate synthase large subunit